MKKRIISILAIALLLVVNVVSVNASSHKDGAEFSAKDAPVYFNVAVPQKLRKYVEEFMGASAETLSAMDSALLEELKNGTRVSAGIPGVTPEDFFVMMPITTATFEKMIDGRTPTESYKGLDIYPDDYTGFFTYSDGFLIAGEALEAVKKTIDQGENSENLNLNVGYQKVKAELLKDGFVNLYFSLRPLVPLLNESMGSAMAIDFNTVAELVEYLGLSVAETTGGYEFKLSVYSDEEFLKENNFEFDQISSFTPSLYKKMSSDPVIFYSESFNAKGEVELTDRIIEKVLGEELAAELKVYEKEFESETGWNVNEDVYGFLDQEIAVAVQHNEDEVMPFVTFMANVANTREKAAAFIEKFEVLLDEVIAEGNAEDQAAITKGSYVLEGGTMTLYTVDFAKIPDFDGPPLEEPVSLLMGITDDGTFVVTTDSKKGKNFFNGKGLSANADFTAAYTNPAEKVYDIGYVNMREVWATADSFVAWADSLGDEFAPPLDFYSEYYALLDVIYPWKDLFMFSSGGAAYGHVQGMINIDKEKHLGYEEFVDGLQNADSDNDGISDFEEKYKYKSYAVENDSDGDGVGDFEEVHQGFNPNGEGALFKDVSQDQWYQEDLGEMYLSGNIKGYEDNTYRPGADVSRREFTAMVMRAFRADFENTFGFAITPLADGDTPPFSDVSKNDWAYNDIVSANRLKFIGGYTDGTFHPNDPITRAEAAAILSKASGTLKKTAEAFGYGTVEISTECHFQDVDETQWFYGAVNTVCVEGVAQGKKPGEFRPLDNLTRAEAAVLIKRTLDVDFENFAEQEASATDLFEPLLPAAGALGDVF